MNTYSEKMEKRKQNILPPQLKKILNETHGLFVYQEQIMEYRISSIKFYTPGDADLLRRAMGKKKASEMKARGKNF